MSRFAVNNIFIVAFCSKWNHVSRSRVTVNGITVMDKPYPSKDFLWVVAICGILFPLKKKILIKKKRLPPLGLEPLSPQDQV